MSTDSKPVAIVTGAGSGIGRACARKFAAMGMSVVVADLCPAGIDSTCEMIEQGEGDAHACQVNVASEADCQTMADVALDSCGKIDILVANAGVQIGGSLLESTEADWDQILGVNLKGVAYSCKAVLPSMIDRGSGSIVINSSLNALLSPPDMAIYDMSKAGTLGLMRSLAVQHGQHGIRVNAVCPGNTITDFHINRMAEKGIGPDQLREMTEGYGLLGRAAEPEEIAECMYFLASEESSFITGQAIVADGGFSLR